MKINQISMWAAISFVTGASIISSCSSSNNSTPSLPAIGGYNTANDVGNGSLIAYWPFDGNYNETKQNLTGTNNGASFTTGIVGQAYQGSGASNVLFSNPGTAFNTLNSYTLSVWIKESAQPINDTTKSYIPGQGAQGIFFVYDKVGAQWNLLHLDLEPYNAKSDSLKVHAGFNNTGAPNYKGIVPEGYFSGSIGKWTHLVMSYDGSASTYTLYKNGQPVNTTTAWGVNAPTPTQIYTDATKATPMGNITFKDAPGGIVIGAFPQAVTPSVGFGSPQVWSGNFQGAIDELRVYNRALPQTDVGALYQFGLAGR